MLLCNSSTMTKNGPNSGSPDELALLHGFKQLGGFILAKDETVVRLRLPRGGEETWKIERVNAFSSERKRMSVVVRNGETGEIRLYMKVRNRADFCHPGSRRQRASPLRPQSRGSGFGPAVAFAGNAARLPHHGVRLPRFFVRSVGRLRGAFRFRGNRGEIAGPSSGLDVSPRGSVQCSEEDVERDADALGTCAIEDSLQEGVSETVEVRFPRGCEVVSAKGRDSVLADHGGSRGNVAPDFPPIQDSAVRRNETPPIGGSVGQ